MLAVREQTVPHVNWRVACQRLFDIVVHLLTAAQKKEMHADSMHDKNGVELLQMMMEWIQPDQAFAVSDALGRFMQRKQTAQETFAVFYNDWLGLLEEYDTISDLNKDLQFTPAFLTVILLQAVKSSHRADLAKQRTLGGNLDSLADLTIRELSVMFTRLSTIEKSGRGAGSSGAAGGASQESFDELKKQVKDLRSQIKQPKALSAAPKLSLIHI